MNKNLLLVIFLLFMSVQCSIAQTYTMGNSVNTTCGGTFYDSGGNLGQYQRNERDTMTICSGTAGQCVRVTFTSFDIEATFDFLTIYNGPTTASPIIGTYTGTTSPGLIISSSGCLTFVFSSDFTINHAGWSATISCGACAGSPCASTCSGGTPPVNDACSGAQSLGALPIPAACPNGVGAIASFNTSNLCATAEFPYVTLVGCQPAGNMASPAADVWYTFTLLAPTLNVNITGLQTPQVGLFEGTNCNNLIGRGCAIGSGGSLNTSFGSLAPGQYFLQVSGGDTLDRCAFILALQNNYDCAGCVIQSNIVANPPPVNGTYQAGQTVNFCYTITDYNQTSNNWLHGVVPSFGPGWNLSTLVATPAANCNDGEGPPVNLAPGVWSWYNTTIVSSATGLTVGPGFFFETSLGSVANLADANPGNNFGDYNFDNICDWTFCWTVQTLPPAQCVQGTSCNITVDTYGDGESGSWTSFACNLDPLINFFATLTCCTPPTVTTTPISCSVLTGTATATGQGTGPWEYTWLNNVGAVLQSSVGINGPNTITNLPAGSYIVQVVDSTGCSTQQAFSITSSAALTATISSTPATCFGGATGTATVVPSGGAPAYTYLWSPGGGTNSTATGLIAGNYSVTVTDQNGCIATQTINVAQPTLVTATPSGTNITCNGTNNGTATVVASGGTAPYSYSWTPGGGTGATISNLGAVTYTVTVTDNKGCQKTASYIVTQPTTLTASITGSAMVNCNGGNNGSATVTVGGGTPVYTYSWAPSGGTGATASNLIAGNYTVTVTDAHNCTATANVVITQPTLLTATINSSNNVSCNGGSNGTATVVANGGTPIYTYSWSPSGGTGTTASGLSANNYTITVTDAHGCQKTAAVTINQPPILHVSTTPTNATCNGTNSGSASSTVTGGTGPYSYLWLPTGDTTATSSGLAAGNYTVTVTDSKGCSKTAPAVIGQPTAITFVANSLPANCGSSNGSGSVVASGGTPAYSYLWSPSGGTATNATGLAAGPYSVTITDANGCIKVAPISVSNIAGPVASILTSTNVLCNGGTTGAATVSALGGTAPYTYSWSPSGGTGQTANGLGAGNYSVTVTDAHGCSSTTTVTITEPNPLVAAISNSTNVNCSGGNTGSATVLASGGSPGYNYTWAPSGGTVVTASNLTAGNYIVTVRDLNGCTTSSNVTITQPPLLTSVIPAPVNVSCNGGNNGSATVNANGGTAPYIYLWTPSGGTGSVATGLAAGNYNVLVTDNHGCTSTSSVLITQPLPVTATMSLPLQITCNGSNNGSATVTPAGGTSPYTYLWSPSGGSNATATNLGPGNYTVVVTDANGCINNASVTITQPTLLVVTIPSSTNILCNGGNNGSATASASGGTSPYLYSWAPSGGNAAIANNLIAGNYTVTVTDAKGCTQTATITITQPTPLASVIPAPSNVSCNGGANGSVTVNVNGGTPIYMYLWSPSGGTGASANGLIAGNYIVTVTDSHGCQQTANTTITQPNPLTATIPAPTNVMCNGGANGTATVNVNGGTAAYAYQWSPSGGTNATTTGLTIGNYTVTVTDAHGCQQTANTSIAEPTPLTISTPATTNANCNGGTNGSASIIASGGTPGYLYSWLPLGGTNANATGLAAGNYTVTVTDSRGCIKTATTTITQPTPLVATIPLPTNVNCNGVANGSAIVNVSGGTTGYVYSWSPSGGNSASANGLAAGNYTVTVTDGNGCSQTASTTILQPSPLTASIPAPVNVSCNGGNNGSATVNVNGGTPVYIYSWFPSGGTGVSENNLAIGSYTVNITDAHGCITSAAVTILQPLPIVLQTNSTPALCGSFNGTAAVNANGGNPGYLYSWSPGGGNVATITGLAAAAYTVTVTDANGCQNTAVANVVNTGGPNAAASVLSHVSCHRGNNGSAFVNITAGVAPYNIVWAPGGGTAVTATGLTAGNYTVTVTDANNCISSDNITITEPTALVVNVTPVNALCKGASNGAASAIVAGGIIPYTFSWSPSGGTTATASGLSAGNYTVTVTDSNSCVQTASAIVGEPAALSFVMSSLPTLCNGSANGSASAIVNGGTPGYAYAWTPSGGAFANAGGLSSGSYIVTVTDAHTCSASDSVVVSQPTAIGLITNTSPAICGASNGSATVFANGGSPGYLYSWSPAGGTAATANGLTADAYTVTVTDANGCQNTAVANVVNTGGPAATASVISNVSCHGGNNGSASVNIIAGVGPYNIVWTPAGGTSVNATGLIAGNYSVTVTDANGCVSSDNITITEPATLVANATATAAVCHGGADGSTFVIVAGGVIPYTFSWLPSGGNAANALGLSANNYTVTVTDSNGCIQTASASVSEPTALHLVMASSPALCNGGTNGTASVIVTGGTLNYSYAWTPSGGNTSNATGLDSGNYIVIITDAHNCIASDSIVVTEPSAIGLITNTLPALCGASNGSANVVANGGASGYLYSWSPVGGTASIANGLAAAAYTVTVTDANGCQNTAVANVVNTGGPAATASVISNVSCHGGNNGSASVNIIAGVGPYNIVWTPAGGTSVNATGLIAGNYSVTVTDANGCVSSDNITITEPATLVANATATAAVCHGGADGSTFVIVAGGVIPYTFSWLPSGGNAANALGLSANNYTVTVTDSNGCIQTASASVSEPTALHLVMASSPALCNGGTNGTASVIVTGGTLNYSYAWTPSGGNTSNATGLDSGNYIVTITDAHNCVVSDSILVTQPAAMLANIIKTDASCHGSSDGTASVVVSGGTAAYQYSWSPGGSSANNISGLTAGNYSVTISDTNGCTKTVSTLVGEAAALSLSMDATPALCHGQNNGSASVLVSGGIVPYGYTWSPSGSTGANGSGLAAGHYSVTVIDSHGCISSDSIDVTEPVALTANASATDAMCHGSSDGTNTVIAAGGTTPYVYAWAPSGGTAAHAVALASNNYTVTITDANGCMQHASASVGQPSALNLVMSSSAALCHGDANGSASVVVSGGTSGYSYSWSPSGGSTPIASALNAGSYTVIVADAHNCLALDSISVIQPTSLTVIMSMNPALCNASNDGSATAIVAGGTFPYQYVWSPSGATGMIANNLSRGNYTVVVSDDNGCSINSSIAVTAPSAITLGTTNTSTSCHGGSDGSASAIPNGGTQPYTYLWSPSGVTLDVATNLTSGNYSVVMTDSHGCSATASAFVPQPTAVNISVAGAATICIGQATAISVNASGGTSPYDYLWSNGNTASSQNVSPIITTIYTVLVEDTNGCATPIQSVTVTVNPALNVFAAATPVICEGDDANISSFAMGGNGGPYSYSWNNGLIAGSSAIVSPTRDSTFIVVVTDGCGTPPAFDTASIVVNPLPKVAFLPHLISGCKPVQADFLNYSTPPGSMYVWDLGDHTLSNTMNASHRYTIPGYYTVSLAVESPQGCLADLTIPNAVIVYGLPEADFIQSTNVTSILNSQVTFTDNSIDAISWEWDFGDSSSFSYDRNPVHNYADTGSYRIRLAVTSIGGCVDTSYGRLRVEDEFAIYIPNAFTPNGDGVNDGFIAFGVGYKDYDMWIIDRWGKQIFHSTAKDQPWNGSYYDDNNLCQNDVYEYIIAVHDGGGKEHKFIGHVTLVR